MREGLENRRGSKNKVILVHTCVVWICFQTDTTIAASCKRCNNHFAVSCLEGSTLKVAGIEASREQGNVLAGREGTLGLLLQIRGTSFFGKRAVRNESVPVRALEPRTEIWRPVGCLLKGGYRRRIYLIGFISPLTGLEELSLLLPSCMCFVAHAALAKKKSMQAV